MMKLRFSSSRQPYRRGGLRIGPKHAPSIVDQGTIAPAAMLAILNDPVITIGFGLQEELEGEVVWETVGPTELAEAAEQFGAFIAAEALRQEGAELATDLLDPPEVAPVETRPEVELQSHEPAPPVESRPELELQSHEPARRQPRKAPAKKTGTGQG